jgi:hypothetical protein
MDAPHTEFSQPQFIASTDPSAVGQPPADLMIDVRDRRGRRMLATTEPVDPTPAGDAVARHALSALRRGFIFAERETLIDAVTQAFETANRDVYDGNGWAFGGDRRRSLVGATAVVTDGDELVVALASPGQAIVIQDSQLFSFPDLTTWRSDYSPDCHEPGCDPLGLSGSVAPALYQTTIAPGDTLLIGSTAIGRSLAESPHLADLAENPSWLPAEVKRLSEQHRQAGCLAWLSVCAEATPAAEPYYPGNPIGGTDLFADEFLSSGLKRAIYFDRLRTRLIELFERHAPVAGPPLLPLAAPRRAAGPPGAGYVRRYRGAWRSDDSPFSLSHRSPGFQMPVRGRAIVAFLAIVLLLSGLYAGYDYRQARASQTGSYLAEADASLAAITNDLSPALIETHLTDAESALAAAARDGASDTALRSRREAIAAIRDRASNVTRLTDVARLGTLPESMGETSRRLVIAGGDLYLIADAVYRVDASTRSLVLMLEPGDRVAGGRVGEHLIATSDGNVLTVSDSRTLYRLATGDAWEAADLGPSEGNTPAMGAIFNDSFYVLDPEEGDILKYPADHLGAAPEVWLQDKRGSGPVAALDMIVDRSIFVLTAEGEIATYFRGKADGLIQPEIEPPFGKAVALAGGPGFESVYLVETNEKEGRILRFDRNGRNAQALLMPYSWQETTAADASDELAHVADFAVDEGAGTIYFVGREGIWRASIPPEESTR